MIGTTVWVKRNVPSRLKAIRRCHSAKLSSSTPAPELRDDRTAADGIDQDVDPAEFLLDRGNRPLHLSRIEGVAKPPVRRPAGAAQGGDRLVEAVLMIVDADDDRTFARHDLGGGTADPVGEGGDQRDLAGEPHRFPLSF